MDLGRHFRTVRHIRFSQLVWRLRYLLERRLKLWRQNLGQWRWPEAVPPRLRGEFPTVPLPHGAGQRGSESAAPLKTDGQFRFFFGQSRQLGRDNFDWRLEAIREDRLWTILHFHAWSYELAEAAAGNSPQATESAALFRHYLSDWIARCTLETPGGQVLAWRAHTIANRLIWWIRCYQLLGPHWRDWGELERDVLINIWQQAAYLHDHLAWDLRANHLMREVVGLAWAGRFFDDQRAGEWRATATRLGGEQSEEQVLSDGGHFERSPMYHTFIMEDLFSLILLLDDVQARARLREVWRRMAEFLAWVRHPDGDLALFNDGSLIGEQAVASMLNLGKHLGLTIDLAPRRGGCFFPQTGLAVWHGDPWTLFFDVGPLGPDYQSGHGHADTLTIECSFRERRLFVDPGVYSYAQDDRRRYDRSTAAHNTVCLDEQDSSEVWHTFRVGRRAYPLDVRIDFAKGGMRASACHNGYDHLPGRPRHTRSIETGPDRSLKVIDAVTGQGDHLVRAGFLLSPEWAATPEIGGWLLQNEDRSVRVTIRGPAGLSLSAERQPYHPDFGSEFLTTRLNWRVQGPLPVEVFTVIERI